MTSAAVQLLFVLLATVSTGAFGAAGGNRPAVYMAPTFLTKVANTATPAMQANLKTFRYSTNGNVTVTPGCTMAHDEVTLASAAFDSLSVVPHNATHLAMTLDGLTPLVSPQLQFGIGCSFNGVFDGALHLPQRGSLNATITFAPSITYHVPVVITAGRPGLGEAVLVSPIAAAVEYGYAAEGFALDVFAANYFKNTLTAKLTETMASFLANSGAFASAWTQAVGEGLSIGEFVCSTHVAGTNNELLALWMEPGCSTPPFTPNFSLMATHDVLVVLPSTDSEYPRLATFGPGIKLATEKAQSAAPTGDCQALPGCQFDAKTSGSMKIALANCTVCYPDNGRYTSLALVASPQLP